MREGNSVARMIQKFVGVKKTVLVPNTILLQMSDVQIEQSEFRFNPTRHRKDYTVYTDLTPGSYMMVVLVSVTVPVPKESNPLKLHFSDQLVPGDIARSLSPSGCLARTVSNQWHDRLVRPSFLGNGEQDALSHVLLHQFKVERTNGKVRSEFSLVGHNHDFKGIVLVGMNECQVSQQFDEHTFTRAYVDSIVSDPKKPTLGQEWQSVLEKDVKSPDYFSGKFLGQKQWEDFRPRLSSEKVSMAARHT